MSTSLSTTKPGILQAFSAVDLVTVAVFAALHRALWYVWHALGMFYPWSQVINTFFLCLCAIAVVVIVRKPWTITLFIIANQLINLFLQGEPLVGVILYICTFGILADIFLIIRLRQGKKPYDNAKDLMIAGTLLVVVFYFITYTIGITYIYMISFTPLVFWGLALELIAGGILGSWLGILLGRRLSGLIS